MIEAAISGFWQTVAWPAFGYMLLGIIIGFWVGLLPGIGGLSTLALMLPFSYSIKEPISAFAFLLGMLAVTGTNRGPDFNSIRHTRGRLVCRAYLRRLSDVEERRGRAAPWVRRSRASLFGSVIGALSLRSSIPIMRPLVLLFGSPELFIIAIMGITFIGTLAGPSLIKGLLSRRHRSDARGHRRRPSDRILAIHFRISLFMGPTRHHSRRRGNVRDP